MFRLADWWEEWRYRRAAQNDTRPVIQMVDKDEVIAAIEQEEEFTGPMPEHLYQEIRSLDSVAMGDMLRSIVRMTKREIVGRIHAL